MNHDPLSPDTACPFPADAFRSMYVLTLLMRIFLLRKRGMDSGYPKKRKRIGENALNFPVKCFFTVNCHSR